MQKYSLPFVIIFALCALGADFASAQDRPRFEVFGGYSNLRPETHIPAVAPPRFHGPGHGVAVSAAFNLTDTFGIGIDWSRHWLGDFHYESPLTGSESFYRLDAKQDRQDFFIGPRLRVMKRGPLSVSLKAGVGAISLSSEGKSEQPGLNGGEPIMFELDTTTWKFASSFGGSLDLDLSRNLSWRIAQPEVIYWRDGQNRTDLKVSTGLVFRFGGR
jgi:hypothetical protein